MRELIRAIALASASTVVAPRHGVYNSRPVVRNSKFGNVTYQK